MSPLESSETEKSSLYITDEQIVLELEKLLEAGADPTITTAAS